MSENFDQMVATIKNYFPLIFHVLLGTAKLIMVKQFVCEKKIVF